MTDVAGDRAAGVDASAVVPPYGSAGGSREWEARRRDADGAAALEVVEPKAPMGVDWLPGLDVAALRQAYEADVIPLYVLCARFGVTNWQIRRLREAGSWRLRDCSAPGGGRSTPSKRNLKRRLNRLVAESLAILEERLAAKELDEENAKLLTELCRAQEIFMRIAVRPTTRPAAKAGETRTHDSDRRRESGSETPSGEDQDAQIRAELERRLDRLCEPRGS
jgi:hypothetical protein